MAWEAWRRKYVREPAPWRAGPIPGFDSLAYEGRIRVLDVGAGGGKSTAAARAKGWSVTALDYAREGLGAASVVGDARALPFRDGAFRLALLVHVLGHVPEAERERVARETMRVASDQFVVVFGRNDARATSGAETAEPWTRVREGVPTHYFEPSEIGPLLPGAFVRAVTTESRWGRREVIVASRSRAVGPSIKQS